MPVAPSHTPDAAVPPVAAQKSASLWSPMLKQEAVDGLLQHSADGSVVVVVGQLAGADASLRRNVFSSLPSLATIPPNSVQ